MNNAGPSKIALSPLPAGDRGDYVRSICRQHAPRLLVMASLLLEDADIADDIVVAAIAAAARSEVSENLGAELALSVYHRCIGHLAVMERFPELARPAGHRPTRFEKLAADERAALALAVFGGLDVTQTAGILRQDVPSVAGQLVRALSTVDSF